MRKLSGWRTTLVGLRIVFYLLMLFSFILNSIKLDENNCTVVNIGYKLLYWMNLGYI